MRHHHHSHGAFHAARSAAQTDAKPGLPDENSAGAARQAACGNGIVAPRLHQSDVGLGSHLKMINIRTAKPEDVPQLVMLLKTLFAIEADFDFNADKQARGLQLLLQSDQACILVAELGAGNDLCAMCSLQILISTAEGGEVGLLEDLVVAADFRNQGIGAKLLAEIVDWAGQRGLKRLQLLADKNNSPALGFYERQGWQSTQLVCLTRCSSFQLNQNNEI